MSTTEWLVMGIAGPLLITLGWVQTIRVWRSGADVSAGINWVTGGASVVGYHAFLLPATACFTLTGVGILLTATTSSGVLYTIGMWAMALGLLFLALSFWMWLFARPQFLVPPHLRGRPGWIGALRQQRRREREQDRLLREQLGQPRARN